MPGVETALISDPPVLWVFVALFLFGLGLVVPPFQGRSRRNYGVAITIGSVLTFASVVGITGCVLHHAAQRAKSDLAITNEHYGLSLTEMPAQGRSELVEHDGRELLVVRDSRWVLVLDVSDGHAVELEPDRT